MTLHGRSVFITGGNTGIGLAAALAFAERGANVALYARRAAKNDEARQEVEKAGVQCITFAADATDEESLSAAIAETVRTFGGLHYAFNNVGVSQRGVPITEVSESEYEFVIDGNLRTTFLAMKHEIPAIVASGEGGAVCNNASASGISAVAGQAVYSAANFGVVGLTKGAALEYAKDNIRVNVVCPGATTGDMFLRFREEFPEIANKAVDAHPMGRIGLREEVAEAVLFLCTGATFTTGLAFTVDGGRSVG